MKTLNKVLVVLFLVAMASITESNAQDKKVDNAVNHFCETANKFIVALDNLDELNAAATDKEFKQAYNKAVKDWNKVVEAADKLENVEIKESVKAYNGLVKSVNNVEGDIPSDKEAQDIGKNLDKTNNTLTSIVEATCQ